MKARECARAGAIRAATLRNSTLDLELNMICVSIGRGRHKQMIAEHRHLVEQGAELVELRLDYIRRAVSLKRLLSKRPCATIVTCRREQDGGKWEHGEDARLVLLRAAIADGVEYVDLEDDIAAGIPRFGSTKRIISYHDFRETPADLDAVYERLAGMDPDIIKIATMAHQPHDNVRMLRLVRDAKIPTVGMCMGDIGTPSRILAGRFGAPFTYATFHHERSLAPGQLSYRQMRAIYDYDRINDETEVFGVIADPVGHSLSPIIHNVSFRKMGMNRVYLPFRVPREDLAPFIADCEEMGIKGLSVTIPHKEGIVDLLNDSDDASKGIGAANTVVFSDGGVATGYNTDCKAATESVIEMLGEEGLRGRPTVILGSGGVAKAAAFGLTKAGADVTIVGRNIEKTKELAINLECKSAEWGERHNLTCSLLVNGTPVGMHPNVDETPYEKQFLKRGMVVFDTVYNPEQTLLIKNAREQQCRTITGVDMFIRQAAEQFELFTEQPAPVKLMRNALKQATGAAQS